MKTKREDIMKSGVQRIESTKAEHRGMEIASSMGEKSSVRVAVIAAKRVVIKGKKQKPIIKQVKKLAKEPPKVFCLKMRVMGK